MNRITLSHKICGLLTAAGIVSIVLTAAACSSSLHDSSSGTSTTGIGATGAASAEAKAKAPAKAADTELTKEGYTALHVLGFGHADVGIDSAGSTDPMANAKVNLRYAAVYTYTGSDMALVDNLVTQAQQKLASDHVTGVRIKAVGNDVVVQAVSIKALDTGFKAVIHAATHPQA
jgi:hypothetical protein